MFKTILIYFKEFVSQYKFYFTILLFLLIVEGFSVALSILALIPLADFFLHPDFINVSKVSEYIAYIFSYFNLKPGLILFLSFFVSLIFVKSIMSTFITLVILKIKYSIYKDITKDILNRFLNTRWQFYSEVSHGKILNTINSEINKVANSLGDFTTQIALVLKFFIYIFVPLIINPTITLMTIFIVLIISIPFLYLNKIGYALGKTNVKTANILIGVFNETLQAVKIIIGFGEQKKSIKRALKVISDHLNVTIKSQIIETSITNSFHPISILAASISLIFVYNSSIPLSELAAVFWSLLACLPLMGGIISKNYSISNFLPSYEQLNKLKNKATNLKEIEGDLEFNSLEKNIIINDIEFKYSNNNYLLKIPNLTIEKEKMTAILGESGAGKSTLIDLMLGFQKPDKGNVEIDGIKFSNYKKNSIRKKIGYVPQDSFLFNLSIKENILWSKENASEEDINKTLKLANAYEFVSEFPKGINTIVGDRGLKLSGGQRQRLAIARALIRKPQILILDEATSSLDTKSEKLIQNSLENISKFITIVVIAHRLSTVRLADKIVILGKGRIIEEGDYRKLKDNRESVFYNMLENQKLI